jgi:large subunit ribosomal protein L14e
MYTKTCTTGSEVTKMTLFSIGRICVKLAGRDAGRKCVVVEAVDDRFVVVDGNVRRKKVNTRHLEPLAETIDIKNKASHSDVATAFEKMGEAVWDKKSKKPAARPRRVKKARAAEEKSTKKPTKKDSTKVVKEVKKPVEEKPVDVSKETAPEVVEKADENPVKPKE